MRILVIGDVHLIAAGRTDRFPVPGDNLILSNAYGTVSGVGTNVAWVLRGLGVEVDLAHAVGEDVFGDAILDELRGRGISTDHMQRYPDPTSVFLILVEPSGERTMIGYRAASERFSLERAEVDVAMYDWVHMSGYTMLNAGIGDAFRRLVQRAEALGIPCSLDLEGIAQAGMAVDLRGLDVLSNRPEHDAYFRTDEIRWPEGAERLIVKDGGNGCVLAEPERTVRLAPYPARVRDLTGAGDAFNAGYIAARLAGMAPEDACRWGNAAGALSVAQPGPKTELTPADVHTVLGEHND